MIRGIGIDLVEIERIQKQFKQKERFMNRILTVHEKAACQQLHSERRQLEYLAGRFAAKEAFSKAVGTGIGQLSFQDIEILNDEHGAPYITATGFDHEKLFISISHTEHYATAQVVIEK
ncbi:MAG TPA: holo-ACP synthase [Candidatus Avamphibacillus intestinigallinarum]|nr:holo-ACP synthase [Candidatus Avamphibacillus intestinigallinarum]